MDIDMVRLIILPLIRWQYFLDLVDFIGTTLSLLAIKIFLVLYIPVYMCLKTF